MRVKAFDRSCPTQQDFLRYAPSGVVCRRFVPHHVIICSQHTVAHCIIGLHIFNTLVSEMNYKSLNRTITQHRKVATSFRDISLFQVFEISLSMLNQVATRSIPMESLPEAEATKLEDKIASESLTLLCNCLSFDFIGTNPEDDAEVNAIQVSRTWPTCVTGKCL
jgi:exportin-7